MPCMVPKGKIAAGSDMDVQSQQRYSWEQGAGVVTDVRAAGLMFRLLVAARAIERHEVITDIDVDVVHVTVCHRAAVVVVID